MQALSQPAAAAVGVEAVTAVARFGTGKDGCRKSQLRSLTHRKKGGARPGVRQQIQSMGRLLAMLMPPPNVTGVLQTLQQALPASLTRSGQMQQCSPQTAASECQQRLQSMQQEKASQ